MKKLKNMSWFLRYGVRNICQLHYRCGFSWSAALQIEWQIAGMTEEDYFNDSEVKK